MLSFDKKHVRGPQIPFHLPATLMRILRVRLNILLRSSQPRKEKTGCGLEGMNPPEI